eukprot:8060886-Lingulodinium_polyedra.AAC.1
MSNGAYSSRVSCAGAQREVWRARFQAVQGRFACMAQAVGQNKLGAALPIWRRGAGARGRTPPLVL